MSRSLLATLSCAILAVVLGLVYFTKTNKPAPGSDKPPAGTPASTEMKPPSGPSNETMELAIVGDGEGIEHAFIRQLEAQPVSFGFSGDVEDSAALRLWAQKTAHTIAIKAGYVDSKRGAEIRVKTADEVAYVIEKDDKGDLRINLYSVGEDPSQDSLETTVTVASNGTGNQFLGLPDNQQIQPQEYLYAG